MAIPPPSKRAGAEGEVEVLHAPVAPRDPRGWRRGHHGLRDRREHEEGGGGGLGTRRDGRGDGGRGHGQQHRADFRQASREHPPRLGAAPELREVAHGRHALRVDGGVIRLVRNPPTRRGYVGIVCVRGLRPAFFFREKYSEEY
jgi:hypothetical protein